MHTYPDLHQVDITTFTEIREFLETLVEKFYPKQPSHSPEYENPDFTLPSVIHTTTPSTTIINNVNSSEKKKEEKRDENSFIVPLLLAGATAVGGIFLLAKSHNQDKDWEKILDQWKRCKKCKNELIGKYPNIIIDPNFILLNQILDSTENSIKCTVEYRTTQKYNKWGMAASAVALPLSFLAQPEYIFAGATILGTVFCGTYVWLRITFPTEEIEKKLAIDSKNAIKLLAKN